MDEQTNQQGLFNLPNIGTVILALITAAAEWGALYAYISGTLPLSVCIGVHLVVVTVLSAWMILQLKTGMDFLLTSLLLVMTAATGPFGSLISVLMLSFYLAFSSADISFLQWLSALFPEEKVEKSIELYQRLSAGWDDFSDKKRIMTFQDALALGTIRQKREALAKISRYFRREFAPALMDALHDSNNAIRVQAATVIAKFEQEYMSRYMQLTKQHLANPEDSATLLMLAQQADAYAYSGILDDEREAGFRSIAAEKYHIYLEMEPDNNLAHFALGRLYIHLGKPALAYEILSGLINAEQKPPLNLTMWLVEGLYSLGKYDEIRELVKRYRAELSSESEHPVLIRDTLQLWESGIAREKLVIKTTNDA